MTKSRGILAKRVVWSPDMDKLLDTRYRNEKTETIAVDLGVSVYSVYNRAAVLGIKKSAEYLASPSACRLRKGDGVGAAGRFKPGHKSWNKGMKGLNLGGIETQFKPGHRGGRAAEIYQPIGAERISKDGYVQRKINDDMPFQKRWRGVHILNWELVNGPLPKGHALVFKDGDKQNTAVENLELVSRADLMRRNTVHNYPKEIAQLVQLRGAINRKINARTNKNEQ